MKNIATWIGLVIGLAGLLLQISVTLPWRMGNGDTLVGSLIFYFSFFTILSNIALVLVYASELWPRQWLNWFRRPATRGMMVGVIVLVGGFNHFFLAPYFNFEGWARVSDTMLHYVTPVVYVAWWVLFARHGMLKFGDIPNRIIPPTGISKSVINPAPKKTPPTPQK